MVLKFVYFGHFRNMTRSFSHLEITQIAVHLYSFKKKFHHIAKIDFNVQSIVVYSARKSSKTSFCPFYFSYFDKNSSNYDNSFDLKLKLRKRKYHDIIQSSSSPPANLRKLPFRLGQGLDLSFFFFILRQALPRLFRAGEGSGRTPAGQVGSGSIKEAKTLVRGPIMD